MHNNVRRLQLAPLFLVLALFALPSHAAITDLIGGLTSNLGVSEAQASGGAGAIFGLAQQNMAPAEFSQVSDAIPGVLDLIKSAPAAGGDGAGVGGLLGGAASSIGGESMGGLSNLAGSFQSLGMGPEMVNQFVPVVLEYVQTQGGEALRTLMQGALM